MYMALLLIVVAAIFLWILNKSSDYFVDSVSKIGYALAIPQVIIGITVVSFGTSLPELVSGITAALGGSTSFVVGSVVGSNIANVFLILGLSVLLYRKTIHLKEQRIADVIWLWAVTFVFVILLAKRVIGFFSAVLLLLLLFCYLTYYVISHKKQLSIKNSSKKNVLTIKMGFILVGSLLGIIFSARIVVWCVEELTVVLGLTDSSSITLSLVAVGTSLPELFVTLSAFRAKEPLLAMGNIIGSNIFNILLVLGIPALITGVYVPQQIVLTSIIFIILSTVFFTYIMQTKRLPVNHSYLFLLIYAIYMLVVFF